MKIVDDPAQGIKVEVTEKQNGKEVTKKYEAKNAEELKKKLPAGYEIYKKYGGEQQGNGALQLRLGAEETCRCPRFREMPFLPSRCCPRCRCSPSRARSFLLPLPQPRRSTTSKLPLQPSW